MSSEKILTRVAAQPGYFVLHKDSSGHYREAVIAWTIGEGRDRDGDPCGFVWASTVEGGEYGWETPILHPDGRVTLKIGSDLYEYADATEWAARTNEYGDHPEDLA